MRRWLFLVSLSLVYSQRIVTLKLLDSQTSEGIPGAKVWSNQGRGFLSNEEGLIRIPLLSTPETLSISSLGYAPAQIVLTATSPETITLNLKPEGLMQEAVVLAAFAETRTEVSLLQAIHQTPQVVSGLSAQTLERLPDRTAAQAASRITGITLQEGRYVVVRGMNERYNTILIDGLPAPSTEPESRTFDLELLPSGLLDQILVYKTPSALYSGDFGGGIVAFRLRSPTEKPFLKLQLRSAYRMGTTGQAGLSFPTSLWQGGAPLPPDFPQELTSPTQTQAWMAKLPTPFISKSIPNLPPASGFSLTGGYALGNRFWGLTAASLSQDYQNLSIQRYRYERRSPNAGENLLLFAFQDAQTTSSLRLSAAQRLSFLPNSRHRFDLTAVLIRIAEKETILRTGYSYYQRADDLFRNYSFQFLDRWTGLLQLGGTHHLSEATKLFWQSGLAYSRREEPDFQRIRTVRAPSDSVYRIILPPGPTTFDAARFYSSLQQYNLSGGGYLQTTFHAVFLIGGVQVEYRKRQFSARWFSYTMPSSYASTLGSTWSGLPLGIAFSPEWLPYLRLREGTNPTDKYEAEQAFIAPFLMLEKSWLRWRLQTGLRYEYSYQRLRSATATGPIDHFTPFPLLMPFANLTYHLTEKSQARLAYARSLNRPELRELAPFTYYNFALTVDQAGNPALKPATLHHLEARYTFNPSLEEMIALGGFFKYIKNPIENYLLRGADNPILQFGSATSAYLAGIEAEGHLRLTKQLQLIGNLSWIYSRVDMGSRVVGLAGESQARFRALQGQAPYMVNLILTYHTRDQRWQVSTALQQIGPRIFWVGDNLNPTIYEMPRLVWDLSLRRKLGKGFVALQGRDLLNQPYVYRQDTNLNNRIEKNEEIIFRYVRGLEISLAAGISF